MKAIKQIIVTLIVGCVLALSLTSNIHAESYYYAKDPDLPPLPFNRHPELPVVEIEKGKFLVDDTSIPDTAEKIAARKLRQEAAEQAKALANDPIAAEAARVAQQAAQEAAWAANRKEIAPWIVQAVSAPNGNMLTADTVSAQSSNALELLSASIAFDDVAEKAGVSAFVQTNAISLPQYWHDEDGKLHLIDRLDEIGNPLVKTTFNVESAVTVSADKTWPGGSTGFNLTGTNVTIGVWDGGDVLTNHNEFRTNQFRVIDVDGVSPYGISDHATHVTGTVAAWGVSTNAKGFSHRGKVLASDFDNDLAEMPSTAAANALRSSNHSYGYSAGWTIIQIGGNYYYLWTGDIVISTNEDWHFGYYDSVARTNDQIIYTAQTYLPVFSAGNERGTVEKGPASQPFGHYEYSNGVIVVSSAIRPLDDANGGFDTLTSYAVSKNNLVVGAVSNIVSGYSGSNSVGMSTFSGFGPADDGRIKPDITAAGVDIYSTIATSTNAYDTYSGTSMAAPSTTGALGLLTELHERLYGTNQPMLASTLKGLVIATADEAGTNAGPDFRFGWGLLNAQTGATLLTNNFTSGSLANIKEVRLGSGDYIQFPVVATNTNPLRVTICWTDPAGTPAAVGVDRTNQMLINDLDLRLVSPSGSTNFPWVLNPASPASAATTGDNVRDNVEQVHITTPTNGQYLVRVGHKGSLVNDAGQTSYQNISILISGNVAQPPIVPVITSIMQTSSNELTLVWSSEVGRTHRVQYTDDLTSVSWQYETGELSITKTNTATTVSYSPNLTSRFYRIEQVR